MKVRQLIVLGIGGAIVGVAVAAISLAQVDSGTGSLLTLGSLPSCANSQATIGVLARLKPGSHSIQLSSYNAIPSSEANLVVVHGTDSMPDPSLVMQDPAVQSAGYLMAQTRNQNLRSCNYRLSDNLQAQSAMQSVAPALISSGLISDAEFNDPSTILIVTDDPTNMSHYFFAAVKATPLTSTSPGTLTGVVATVDRATMRVISVGLGHWYE